MRKEREKTDETWKKMYFSKSFRGGIHPNFFKTKHHARFILRHGSTSTSVYLLLFFPFARFSAVILNEKQNGKVS